MKLKAPDAAAATARSPINCFSGIFFVAFLTIIYASSAVAKTGAGGLNPAEEWVVTQITAGEIADLSKQFPEETDRKLSAYFLEDLLMGTLPGVKPHRHGVRIIGATIDEPIDLTNAQIPCEVWLDLCQFNKDVTFTRANFAGALLFRGSRFKEGAAFSGMKVGGDAFLQCQFNKGGTFKLASFAGVAVFSGGAFKRGANFERMKVGGDAFFADAVFEQAVNFIAADIAGEFVAQGAKFQNEARFTSMKVRGRAFFNASFEGPVSFEYADFAWLRLSNPFWTKVATQFKMQGMSYKYVSTVAVGENEPESHKALLKLADQSTYTADVYSRLEEFFLRQGYRGDADRAFIAGKRRERKEKLHGLGWFGSCLLDWLVGYGRRPWQAGIPCAALIALGCVLFSPKKMEPQKPEDAPRVYSRFWYSLGLFLPVVDLQADKVWKPKADQTFLRNYMRVHILLGWILVPLVLAALTGLIK